MELHLPTFPLPQGYDTAEEYLFFLGLSGAIRLYQSNFTLSVLERIRHELEVINKNNLANYFLIWADIVRFCDENQILTSPGRQNSLVSEVLYCVGINKFDPLSELTIASLPFEFFTETKGFPSGQMSLMVENGGLAKIFNYLQNKYGKDRVSYISSYCKSSNGKTYHSINPFEILLTDKPVTTYTQQCSVECKDGTYIATVADKKELQEMGLTSFSIIELNVLSIIKNVERHIGLSLGWNRLPLKDEKTWSLLNQGKIKGSFLLSSKQAIEELIKRENLTFNDLIDIVAMPYQIQNINKAYVHFYCYALIAFRCAYLEANYPDVFNEVFTH